ETRFDFAWDASRLPDARETIAAIHEQAFRVALWEYPYVSVHSELFADLASRRYLLTTREGDPYVLALEAPASSGAGAAPTPPPESGIVDFSHPAAYAWWRDAHEGLFADGVDVLHGDFGEQIPDDAVAFNGDSGTRLHNVYPLLYAQCLRDATEKFGADQEP